MLLKQRLWQSGDRKSQFPVASCQHYVGKICRSCGKRGPAVAYACHAKVVSNEKQGIMLNLRGKLAPAPACSHLKLLSFVVQNNGLHTCEALLIFTRHDKLEMIAYERTRRQAWQTRRQVCRAELYLQNSSGMQLPTHTIFSAMSCARGSAHSIRHQRRRNGCRKLSVLGQHSTLAAYRRRAASQIPA